MYSQGWSEIRKAKKRSELSEMVKTVALFIIGGSIMIMASAELALIVVSQF